MVSQFVAAFIAWLVTQGIPCTGYTSVTGNGTTDWPPAAITLTFDPSATQEQINQSYGLVQSFVYVPELDGSKAPNPRGFQSLILNDQNIPANAKAELMKYFALLEQHANNPAGLRSGWAVMLSAYGDAWLTPSIRTIIEAYAVQSNMPLTE